TRLESKGHGRGGQAAEERLGHPACQRSGELSRTLPPDARQQKGIHIGTIRDEARPLR
ncbi:hypothetical protein NHX12_017359, partial [Muraenolepis orangiensis]